MCLKSGQFSVRFRQHFYQTVHSNKLVFAGFCKNTCGFVWCSPSNFCHHQSWDLCCELQKIRKFFCHCIWRSISKNLWMRKTILIQHCQHFSFITCFSRCGMTWKSNKRKYACIVTSIWISLKHNSFNKSHLTTFSYTCKIICWMND